MVAIEMVPFDLVIEWLANTLQQNLKQNCFSKSEEELLIHLSEAGLVRFSAFQKEKILPL